MPKRLNLTGIRFERLVPISYIGYDGRSAKWLCKCDCGKEVVVAAGHLRNNHTRSCGCYRRDKASEFHYKHGSFSNPEYRVWSSMKQRCENPHRVGYEDYGGRGIKVCDRWRESFNDFLEDLGPRPSLQHSIDRLDVNGNYEPDNCKWATPGEQARNRRSVTTLQAERDMLAAKVRAYEEKYGQL